MEVESMCTTCYNVKTLHFSHAVYVYVYRKILAIIIHKYAVWADCGVSAQHKVPKCFDHTQHWQAAVATN
jgi:hypothetical protein